VSVMSTTSRCFVVSTVKCCMAPVYPPSGGALRLSRAFRLREGSCACPGSVSLTLHFRASTFLRSSVSRITEVYSQFRILSLFRMTPLTTRPRLGPDDQHLSYIATTPEREAVMALALQQSEAVRAEFIMSMQDADAAPRLGGQPDDLVTPPGTPSDLQLSFDHKNGVASATWHDGGTFEVAEGADPVHALFEVGKKGLLKGMKGVPDMKLVGYDSRTSSRGTDGHMLSWHTVEMQVECDGRSVIATGEGQSLKQAVLHAFVRMAVHTKVLALPVMQAVEETPPQPVVESAVPAANQAV